MPEATASEPPVAPADPPMRIVLMGTGPFAVPTFDAIRRAGHSIALVVTRPERIRKSRKGPPPAPVRAWANQHDLPIFDPPSINDAEAVTRVAETESDLLFVCDYGQILSPQALETARLGGLNLHGSLLPAYRGAAPVQWALWQGEQTTGVSVIHMTPRLDGGPIVAQDTLAIDPHETAGQLEDRLAQRGVSTSLRALDELARWDGQSLWGQPQDPAAVTKAPRLKKSDGHINWKQSAQRIDYQVRAMQPWPTAFTLLRRSDGSEQRLTIREVAFSDRTPPPGTEPGTPQVDGQQLFVACGDAMVQIRRLQPAGKREMAAADYLRGHPLEDSARFE
ncbi:methionyl-tRNA formyltransferase [Roseimaritima sediminicola]|uniref:methionyl-tRNA formyltransferase n=1 Tax=Roseimaritima sediminicola TaxID=2662066 RepID=UPI00129838DC|nr:methionyl-tRNA formyltransferase [Roseimaritima sediminicola]